MRNDTRIDAVPAMLVFAEVVASGSFSEAARRLRRSKASVSRDVAALERRLGAQLLRRTTRRMSLTEVGEAFHARCQRVAEEAEAAERSVQELQAEPRGLVRLAAPMSFGHLHVAPLLPGFLARHPQVRVHLDLTDRRIDLVREKFDLSVRIAVRLAESTLVQRKLCTLALALCAAPAYLARRGTPRTVEDLAGHNCLGYAPDGGETWTFARGRTVAARGDLSIDNGDALRRVALQGHGIVYMPTFLVAEDLAAGRLVRLLPALTRAEGGAFAVYPESRHLSPKVRTLIDHLAEAMAPLSALAAPPAAAPRPGRVSRRR